MWPALTMPDPILEDPHSYQVLGHIDQATRERHYWRQYERHEFGVLIQNT